jgi:hypothetical protein
MAERTVDLRSDTMMGALNSVQLIGFASLASNTPGKTQ